MAKKEIKNNKDKTSFVKSFKAELKKVIWPTPKQLFNNTVAVLAIVIITALIVFILDFAFEAMNKYGIDKVKNIVNSTITNETLEEDSTDSTSTEEDDIEDTSTEEDGIEDTSTEEDNSETESDIVE